MGDYQPGRWGKEKDASEVSGESGQPTVGPSKAGQYSTQKRVHQQSGSRVIDGEHAMPGSWTEIEWKGNGGFANQSADRTRGKENARRERIWFSPHCLRQPGLFG